MMKNKSEYKMLVDLSKITKFLGKLIFLEHSDVLNTRKTKICQYKLK